MTNRKHEDDIFIHILVIISILIETFIDAIKCLTSLNSKSSTPKPTKLVSPSSDTTPTSNGNMKSQRLSPSTKPRSTTAVQKKVVGTTKQDSQSSPTASSPRSKRSKPSSNTSTSTRSQTSQASGSRRRTTTTKSTSPTDTLLSIPNLDLTTANGNSRRLQSNHGSSIERRRVDDADNTIIASGSRTNHQSTQHLSLLLGTQEEA